MGSLAWIAGFALMLSGWLITVRAVGIQFEDEPAPTANMVTLLHVLAGFMVITGAMLWRAA